MAGPYVMDYRGGFSFALTPEEVWDAIERSDRFEGWWAWLRDFRREGPGLAAGSVLRGVVSPPVPYQMRVEVVIEEACRPEYLIARVAGDLEGSARLDFRRLEPGTEVEAAWSLEMMQRPMRLAARFARPLLRWGHDRVVESTVAGFRRHVERPH